MLQDFWNDAVLPAMVTLLTAALSILVGVAVSALRAWAAKQEAQWKQAVIEEVTNAVEDAVAAVNQSFVDDIKLAREDGHLTAQEAQTALTRARDIAVERLGKSGMAALQKITGGEAAAIVMIFNLIEAAVKRSKDA